MSEFHLTPRQIAAKVKGRSRSPRILKLPEIQSMSIRLIVANTLSAYDRQTIGAKVLNRTDFEDLVIRAIRAIRAHDFSSGKTPGQAVLDLLYGMNADAVAQVVKCVSSGVGKKRPNPDDYICRIHRGQVHMFLKREFASPVTMLSAVIYTREGYLKDPDVMEDQAEQLRVKSLEGTHVIVAVLATSVQSFVSPYRFIANLAGGNLDYDEGKMTHSELVRLAKQVKDFDDHWAVVAD